MFWWQFLDIIFLIFHTALTIFNLVGWLWKRTRILNLFTLMITAGSWFILGIFYGIGYCPLTEWHWKILNKLDKANLPESYIKYIYDRISGGDIEAQLVEWGTGIGFFLAFTMALVLNIRDFHLLKNRNL